jgi:hypothetical protein
LDLGGLEVSSLGAHAFESCANLTSVTATSRCFLGTVGDFFLADTPRLASISFANMSISSLGVSALFKSGIRQLDLGGLVVTSLGGHAFEGCVNLTSVTASSPCSLGTVGDFFLAETPRLASISFANISMSALGASALFKSGIRQLDLGGLVVTSLGSHAFERCVNLTSVTAASPCSLGAFGDFFLAETPQLALMSFANISMNALGSSALFNSGILHLDLGGLRITSVGDHCFEGCSKLTTVTASSPCSLGVVGDHFLSGTPMLTSVCFDNITVATIGFGMTPLAVEQLLARTLSHNDVVRDRAAPTDAMAAPPETEKRKRCRGEGQRASQAIAAPGDQHTDPEEGLQ